MRNTVNRTMDDNSASPVGGVRRRGNVMLFVIFILGTLFAASMAFLALMRTEAGVMSSRRDQGKLDVIFGGLSDDLVLNSASALMGQSLAIAGGTRVPYVQDAVDNDGPDGIPASAGSTDDDGIVDRSDFLSSFATIPGVHHLVASLEPYDPGTGVLEWFAVSDPYRAWDDRVDVHANPINPALPVEPSLPATRPLRIRPLNGIGLLPPYNYIYDATDDSFTRQWGLSDADGDGVVDSVRYRVALLGNGEADWGLAGPSNNDEPNCGGVVSPPFTGAPSFTTTNPLMLTPLPCDDPGLDGLAFGTVYPRSLRRAIAAKLRDENLDVAADDPDDDLYFSLRLIQNGGMANLGKSHRTLIDNLFGLAEDGTPVAGKMMNLPYGPAVEQALRRRGVLAPLRPNDPLTVLGPLGEDMLQQCPPGAGFCSPREQSLYQTLFGALINQQGGPQGQLQWFPVLDEPGGNTPDDIYDLDWAARWVNPDRWNDLNDSAGLGSQLNYDIAQLLTNVSIDDLLMRNGMYDPDGPAGPIAAVLLNDLTNAALPAPAPYNPASDGLNLPPLNYGFSGDSALEMYGFDPNYVPDAVNPNLDVGDRSFYRVNRTGNPTTTTFVPTLPLALQSGAGVPYGRPRDAAGTPSSDVRFGGLQFALHSIGNINNPTQREIETVHDYFTVMLRNVTGFSANQLADQAAQLTANFIDFADFDAGTPGGGVGINPGQPSDVPTPITSRRNVPPRPVFYGMEKQPYISEVYWDPVSDPPVLAIELTNPHNVPVDLAPSTPVGPGFAPTPYALQFVAVGGGPAVMVTFSVGGGNVIVARTPNSNPYLYATSNPAGLPPGGQSVDPIANVPVALGVGDKIQLVRQLLGGVVVVCDELLIPPIGFPIPGVISTMQRDNNFANVGGWRVTVPAYSTNTTNVGLIPTLGKVNSLVFLPNVAPVHAATDDMGLESAYPTTGAMLLLMRHANSLAAAANATLGGAVAAAKLDNGHMPVFDTAQLAQANWNGAIGAQPMDGTTLLSIPWGQLVFDYFTALPFDNQFDPLADPPLFAAPQEPGNGPDGGAGPGDDVDGDGVPWEFDFGHQGFTAYLRANQPTVELGGVRVHGRININAAPWKVLDGLPLMHPKVIPIYKHLPFGPAGNPIDTRTWANVLSYPNGTFPGPMGFPSFTPTGDGAGTTGPVVEKLGVGKAKGIVAYRELRAIPNSAGTWTTGNYNTLNGGFRWRWDGSGAVNFLANTTQRHTAGFLTVGELANVRLSNTVAPAPGEDEFSQMDNGQTHIFTVPGFQNYLFAVAPLVALGDWVTVKGHTFTAYGVLTGQGDVLRNNPDDETVLDRAERFEIVFDRSNLLISDDPAERPEVIYKVREPLSEVNPN